jgi:ADP-dependent NAD(P)H-hydrate dehydratase / NAD(P)H-hydrate epimerase
MKILTAAQMREVDRLSTERHGIPSAQLMENAGSRFVEIFLSCVPDIEKQRTAIICGKGNNGGDGFVIARLLGERGAKPIVIICGDPTEIHGDAALNLRRLKKEGGEIIAARDANAWAAAKDAIALAGIVIDALFGTGMRGVVEGWLAEVINDLNRMRSTTRIFAVDIPSGLPADTGDIPGPAIEADVTITFTAPKVGQLLYPASERVGRLVVGSIGSPASLVEECSDSRVRWLDSSEFAGIRLRRNASANKGNFGHVLVVAGSLGKTGAAVMAGSAALKAGAGLTTVAAPDLCIPIISSFLPELMTAPLPATSAGTLSLRCLEYSGFTDLLRGKDILAMGPGLTTQSETQEFVRAVVGDSPTPLVLDADGLNAFAGRSGELGQHRAEKCVVTPHPGEMARLLNAPTQDIQRDRLGSAEKAAADLKATVVLKGHQTVIAAPDGRTWINSTGNPGMAKAGSGDVLTGMVAGVLAQQEKADWSNAACLAVYLHGLAGDLAAKESGEISLMATDIIRAIPKAYAKLIAELDHAEP